MPPKTSLRDDYPYTVKEMALLVGLSTGHVSDKLKAGHKFHGIRIKYIRDAETKGCPYMIHRESFLNLQTKVFG